MSPPRAEARRGPLWVAFAASLVGVALSLLLVRVHFQAHAGVESFCSINDVVNCDRVATSPYSVVLGLPVALWGAFGFALAAALALTSLRSARGASLPWVGLLFVVAAIAVAASVVLAFISEARIGALCLLCAGGWLAALVMLESARRACTAGGVSAAVRGGFAVLRARPGRTAAALVVALLAVAAAASAYPRYWDRPKKGPAASAASGAAAGTTAAAGATVSVVVEYSDYECPFCARAHEDTRVLREKRPDLTVVRRQFPLDMSCNPLLKQPLHTSACLLSRAAICAQEQGRFSEMDDALFRNQKERLAVAEVARKVGLDLGRFQSCIASPDTERKLQADIAAGIRDGVRATPTYVIGGVAKSGEFPWELLPPPPGPAASAPGASTK